MKDIYAIIRNYIIQEYNPPELTGSTPLISSGIIDSMHMIDVVCYLEREFNIRIPEEDTSIRMFDTLDKMTRYVQLQLNTEV